MTHWSYQAPWANPVLVPEIRTLLQGRADYIRDDYQNTLSAGAVEAMVGHELSRRIRPWTNTTMYNHTNTLDEGVELLAEELARPWLIMTTTATAFAEVADNAVNFVASTMNDTMCSLGRTEVQSILDAARRARTWRKRKLRNLHGYLYAQHRVGNQRSVSNVIMFVPFQRDEDYWAERTHPFMHVRNLFTREVT